MTIEGLRVPSAEDYPKGTPIRAFLEKPRQELARIREAVEALPNPEQFIAQEQEELEQKGFSHSNVEFPTTENLDEVFDVWRRAIELGFTKMQAHTIVGMDLENTNLPRGWIRLEKWYRQQIGRTIDKDAAILKPAFVLVDTTPKPNYDGGRQLYPNDSFGPLMFQLREEGKIEVPDDYKHVLETSRFAVTPVERETHLYPAFAKILKVEPDKVRVPTAAENNFLGNIHHPEFGQNNTYEWYADEFGTDYRLIGGDSDSGGLTNVSYGWSGYRHGHYGFRLLVFFSS